VLVFIHEFGHFITAKLSGMRVDRFSIGFPPRAFGKKIGDTDYCVSWIPVGGYVKISGMIDESMDTEFINAEPQPWEFRSKPLWARTLVISGGVIMNVLLAVLIFWTIHYTQGSYSAETTDVGYVAKESFLDKAGLHANDKILSINGTQVTRWDEIQNLIYIENLGNDIILNIERAGKQISLFIPAKSIPAPAESQSVIMVGHTMPVIEGIEPKMPASKMGILLGDTLFAINDTTVNQIEAVARIHSNAGKEIKISWKRGVDILSGKTTVTAEGRIGVRIGSRYVGPSKKSNYGIFQAFGQAVNDVQQSVYLFYLTFSKIFAGKASLKESLGGPIAIAQLATQSAEYGLVTFVWFMAQLSMSLAILNILPIPALDGGHLSMMLVERIIKREIPSKVKIIIQQAGFILLLAFMAFIIYNDISRF